MAKRDVDSLKLDPNTEAFQMRAYWKKARACREHWREQWFWLVDERKQTLEESNAIRQEMAHALPQPKTKITTDKSLKPVPETSNGVIGWVANRPGCQLEIYSNWRPKIPLRLPDAWEHPGYTREEPGASTSK